MKFTKSFWFYETEINGLILSVQKEGNKWRAQGARGSYAWGTTREKAINSWLQVNEGRY